MAPVAARVATFHSRAGQRAAMRLPGHHRSAVIRVIHQAGLRDVRRRHADSARIDAVDLVVDVPNRYASGRCWRVRMSRCVIALSVRQDAHAWRAVHGNVRA